MNFESSLVFIGTKEAQHWLSRPRFSQKCCGLGLLPTFVVPDGSRSGPRPCKGTGFTEEGTEGSKGPGLHRGPDSGEDTAEGTTKSV